MNNKKIYKKIAKEHNVSWQEVRDDMQSALSHAYENPNRNILNVVSQSKVPKKRRCTNSRGIYQICKLQSENQFRRV